VVLIEESDDEDDDVDTAAVAADDAAEPLDEKLRLLLPGAGVTNAPLFFTNEPPRFRELEYDEDEVVDPAEETPTRATLTTGVGSTDTLSSSPSPQFSRRARL
jgi:hypothetical protein